MSAESSDDITPRVSGVETETPLAYRVVRGGIWVLISSYWSIGFGFLINIVLTRLLNPEAYGQFAYANFFVQLFLLQPKLGLSYGFVQRQDTTDSALGTFIGMEFLSALGSLLIAGIGVLFLPPDTAIVVLILTGITILQGIAGIGGVLLDKDLRFDVTSRVNLVALTVSYIPAVIMALNGFGVWSLVAQVAIYGIITSVVFVWMYRSVWRNVGRYVRKWDIQLARHYLGFGVTMGIGMFAGSLTTSLDSFFIGTFVGTAALGYYDRAYRMAQWPGLLFNSILSRTAYYTYARLQDDPERLEKSASMLFWMIAMLGVPLALALFVGAPDLIVLLYGERWLPSASLLRILALGFLTRPLWENTGAIVSAVGKPRLTTRVTIIWAIAVTVIGLPMTLIWGTLGTSIAVGIAALFGLILLLKAMIDVVPVDPRPTLATTTVLAVGALALYYVLEMVIGSFNLQLLLQVVVKMGGIVLLYYGLAVLVRPHDTLARLRYVWRLVWKR